MIFGGNVRNKMKVYCWIGGETGSEAAVDLAVQKLNEGYTAIKMNATANLTWIDTHEKVKEVVDRVEAIRAAVGNKLEIGLDFHGRVHKGMAKVLIEALNPYDLMFVEEPVLSQNNEALKELQHYAKMPIATGERMFTRWDFKNLFEMGGADIIQPDPCHAGGIWETRKIAAMAELSCDLSFCIAPSGPNSFAVCLQLDFCIPNAFIQKPTWGSIIIKGLIYWII